MNMEAGKHDLLFNTFFFSKYFKFNLNIFIIFQYYLFLNYIIILSL